jgi:hypothetical protein
MTACNLIKQENKRMTARGKAPTAMVEVMRDPVRICGEDTDDTIFSACNSPDCDDLDSSTASELGEYELSYLHTLYQPNDLMPAHMTGDTILPDAVAPPSLGGGMTVSIPVTISTSLVSPPASSSTHIVLRDMDHDDCESSQPSTPPRTEDSQWCTEEADIAPVVSSMAPSPAPAKPAVVGKTTGRKRKAVTNIDAAPAPPTKSSRTQHLEPRHVPKGGGSTSGDDDDSDNESTSGSSRGRCPMLDGLEIRPEDDPLGLFSRDPSTLTPEEQRILKKQRRLLKNRESAQLSRHRKKMHLHSLEKQVDALKKDKAALAARVQALQEDNERLRKQLIAA